MSVACTQYEFETRSMEIHGDIYDYTKDSYIDMNTPYKILCKKHGVFEMKPVYHIHMRNGCPSCSREKVVEKNKQKHLKRLEELVGSKYTVSDWLSFHTIRNKVVANCEEHGDYETALVAMFTTSFCGCPRCRLEQEASIFIQKAKGKHLDKYSYEMSEYHCSRTPMKIWCRTHEEYFYQRPSAHLQGQGCPICGQESRNMTMTKSQEDFIKEASLLHDYCYNYDNTVYKNSKTMVEVDCPVHGTFEITPHSHLAGGICPQCSKERQVKEAFDNFIANSKSVFGEDAYDYSKVVYKNNHTKICLKCKVHGEWFEITPNKHLLVGRSGGCPVCSKLTSNRWSFSAVKDIPNINKEVGYFYLASISSLQGLKIGVTKNLNHREGAYKRDLAKYKGVTFEYKAYVACSYLSAFLIESICKDLLKAHPHKHNMLFGGKNEVYDIPPNIYKLILDVFSGKYSLELETLANSIESTKEESYVNFLTKLEREYA